MERWRALVALFSLLAGQYSAYTRNGALAANGLPTATIMLTFDETSNGNASNGDAPNKDFYTNCVESCPSGVPSPANSGCVSHGHALCSAIGTCGGISIVVSTTLSGTGTHGLANGRCAGGTEAAIAMTQTFGGATANPCSSAANWAGATGIANGLSYPNTVANSHAVYSLTTDGTFTDTSYLGPAKFTATQAIIDSMDHWLVSVCIKVSGSSGTGVHAELDENQTVSTDDYYGPGHHFKWDTNKWYFCFQGCSSWKEMDVVQDGTGTTISTWTWPDNHAIWVVFFDHRDPGCTSSSVSNCEWNDRLCFQDVTAGTAQICGRLVDPSTGTTPGAIPVNKAGFTINEQNTQTQIDANCSSCTVTFDVWKSFVGYHL